jgi:hypothetical protein
MLKKTLRPGGPQQMKRTLQNYQSLIFLRPSRDATPHRFPPGLKSGAIFLFPSGELLNLTALGLRPLAGVRGKAPMFFVSLRENASFDEKREKDEAAQ